MKSARSLASRRSYLVGLVYDNPSGNYTIEVQRGALARCREGKFLLLLHEVSGLGEEPIQDILTFANQTHLDGLILAPPLSESTDVIRALDAQGLPFVRIAPNEYKHRSPYVDIDDENAAREMTDYLIGLGHRSIGFIIGRPGHFASGERLKGYKAALKTHKIPYLPEYVRQGDFLFDSGLDMVGTPEKPRWKTVSVQKLTCKQSTLEGSSAGGVPAGARAGHIAAKALMTGAKKSSQRFSVAPAHRPAGGLSRLTGNTRRRCSSQQATLARSAEQMSPR